MLFNYVTDSPKKRLGGATHQSGVGNAKRLGPAARASRSGRPSTVPQTESQMPARPPAIASPAAALEEMAAQSEALHTPTRAKMERSFARDLGFVRIHSDASAARSARDLNARAYTFGEHIVFGAGEYTPGTKPGQELIAHELAHVIQQRSISGTRSDRESPDSDRLEQEADRAAVAASGGHHCSTYQTAGLHPYDARPSVVGISG